MDLSEISPWSLEPTDEQIEAQKEPHGRISNGEAQKRALHQNLRDVMAELDNRTDQMSETARALHAVLYHVVRIM